MKQNKISNNKFIIGYIIFGLIVFLTVLGFYIYYVKDMTLFLMVTCGIYGVIYLLLLLLFIYLYIGNQKRLNKLYESAYIDPITGLKNEIYFKEKSNEFINSKKANKYVAVFDINKFKVLCKMYDSEVCNEILKEVGQMIEEYVSNDGITCRITRDFFAVYFTYNGNVLRLVSQMSDYVTIKMDEQNIDLTLAWGIYKLKKEDKDINKILDKAYMAHTKAKTLYKESYCLFDEALEQKLNEVEAIEFAMENALKNAEFKVVYQPKVSVKKEEFAGAEALVRWKRDGKEISPSKFIPIFEKNKFIIKLDLYVFEMVCKDLHEWNEKYGKVPRISVNVSKEHFANVHFIDQYVEIANKYAIDLKNIEIEITESATIDENIDILNIIKDVKKRGFAVSIDDFGTGYTSLSMLQDLPIDIIKIDKTFIDNVDFKSKKNIINHIINISKSLEKMTVVEGVETIEQVEFIKKQKGDLIQGFYFSKPLSKEKFEKYFQSK